MFSGADALGMDLDPTGISTEAVTEGLANAASILSGQQATHGSASATAPAANGPTTTATTSHGQPASIFRRNDAATLVTDAAMRMCDLKGVARPPQFSGKDTDWE